jgi:hypothetical protein
MVGVFCLETLNRYRDKWRYRMRQALPPNKHKEMIDLISQGYSIDEVANWMDVAHSYVRQYFDTPPEIVYPVIEDPYKDFTNKDFVLTDLKTFRQWVIKNLDPDLSPFSKRAYVVSRYKALKNNEV